MPGVSPEHCPTCRDLAAARTRERFGYGSAGNGPKMQRLYVRDGTRWPPMGWVCPEGHAFDDNGPTAAMDAALELRRLDPFERQALAALETLKELKQDSVISMSSPHEGYAWLQEALEGVRMVVMSETDKSKWLPELRVACLNLAAMCLYFLEARADDPPSSLKVLRADEARL